MLADAAINVGYEWTARDGTMAQQSRRKFTHAVPATRTGDTPLSANYPKGGEANSLQKFATVHASLHNHFNSGHHLVDRQTFKVCRSAAMVE
jgi:hypothetical protein